MEIVRLDFFAAPIVVGVFVVSAWSTAIVVLTV